jgi:MoxR-like ATPase
LDSDNIVFAKPGFSVIATANSRDRGVNELSSALKRRFNFVRIPVVTNKKNETEIIRFRTGELLRRHQIELDVPPTLLDVLLQSFADLRASAASAGGDDEKLESALSTAEQIGVLEDAILHSNFFGERTLTAHALARSLVGSLARREPEDLAILNKYLHAVVEPRSKEAGGAWPEFLEGGRDAISALS